MCLYVCKDTVKGICFKESNYSALNWLAVETTRFVPCEADEGLMLPVLQAI